MFSTRVASLCSRASTLSKISGLWRANKAPFAFALVATAGALALTGCGANLPSSVADAALPGVIVQGHVHGGAFPIEGALVTLMETQSTGYGVAGKVLEQVKSNTNGFFTFDNNWTCDAGQYAYIVVSSGHTVASATTNNNNVLQVGVIGSCSQDLATTAEIGNVNVFISELSTVAAAYALNNFISIGTNATYGLLVNISSAAANNAATPGCTGTGANTVCTAGGLGHAFTNAYNLVDSVRYDGSTPTGAARTTIPGNSKTIVPQSLINTLGNILQSCVDSNGVTNSAGISGTTSDGSHCGDLFEYATPPNGTSPSNTLQVALNIANNPNNNVDKLFNLQPRATFFTPALTTDVVSNSTALLSYSISIFYESTGLAGDQGFGTPVHIALDAQDNAYVVYAGYDSTQKTNYVGVDGLSAAGSGLFAGPRIYNVTAPNEIALDNLGYAWLTDDAATGKLYQVATSGASAGAMKNSFAVTNGYPGGVALDESNNVWISRDSTDTNQSIYEYLQPNNYAVATFGTVSPVLSAANKRLFIDSKQNVFGVTTGTSANAQFYVFGFGSLGVGATLTTKALSAPNGFGIAMTSTDEAYLPLNGTLNSANATANGNVATITTNANSAGIYTGTSTTGSKFTNPGDAVIDGAGNIHWTDFESSGQLFKMVPGSDGKITDGTLTSVYPCLPLNNQCYGSSSNLRGLAIDSSGAIWYVAAVSPGLAVQTLGFAGNSWPLLSYAHAGLPVK